MDDFLVIHPSKRHLHDTRDKLAAFAAAELRLALHPRKTNVHKFTGRERFVGYDTGLYTRRLSKPTVSRFMRRLRRVRAKQGEVAALASWEQFRAYSDFAHARGLVSAIDPFKREVGND